MATARSAPNLNIPRDSVARRLDAAVDAFLSQARLSDETRRSYRKTLDALTTVLEAAGAEPTAAAIEVAMRLRWGTVAPATWNRHAATIRSFLGYAGRHGLLDEFDVDLDRRREPADRTRSLPHAALERLWSRRDVALRDKTLWRLLYETAARASEALSLDVEDLDLPARRAVVRGKNGELDYLHWQTGTGHLRLSGSSWNFVGDPPGLTVRRYRGTHMRTDIAPRQHLCNGRGDRGWAALLSLVRSAHLGGADRDAGSLSRAGVKLDRSQTSSRLRVEARAWSRQLGAGGGRWLSRVGPEER